MESSGWKGREGETGDPCIPLESSFSTNNDFMPETATMPEEGQKAPGFSGRISAGETVTLSDFEGKKLALYFYPEDDTPGCTTQACNLRDNYDELRKEGVEIIGVSDDTMVKHMRFTSKYDLPFPLIADIDRTIMDDYGVYGQKKMFGHSYMGTKRTTFLIDERGTIVKVIKRPKVKDHAAEILRGFGLRDS